MSKTATSAPKNGLKGLAIERRFSSAGTHPFDEIEWEIRDAVIGNPESPAFEQRGVEFPKSWSQNATNIVAQKYFRGQLGSDAARVLGQTDDRPRRRDDLRLGARGRLLRLRRGRRRLRGRADLDPAQPEGGLQLAGLVQRRLRGAAAVLGLLHPQRRGHDGVDPRLEHQGGQDLPRRLRLGDQPLQHPRLDGAAGEGRHRQRPGQLHARRRLLGRDDQVRRQDAAGGEDGRARRRPSRTSSTSSGARPTRRRRPKRCATPASTCRSTARASPRSSTRTPTTRCGSPTSSWRRSRPARSGT